MVAPLILLPLSSQTSKGVFHRLPRLPLLVARRQVNELPARHAAQRRRGTNVPNNAGSSSTDTLEMERALGKVVFTRIKGGGTVAVVVSSHCGGSSGHGGGGDGWRDGRACRACASQ